MNEREKQLLEAIVDYYIKYGESVASRTIEKKYKFGISSATIRNTMSDLEEEGLLKKTHTSSGRIPTVEGYKVYLNEFMNKNKGCSREEIVSEFDFTNIDIDNIFKSINNILSKASGGIGFVLEHAVSQENVSNAKLVYINNTEALITMVINRKFVRNSIITFKNITTYQMINEINKYLEDILTHSNKLIRVEDIIKFLSHIGEITEDINGSKEILSENLHIDGILNIIERNEIEIDNSLEIVKYILNNKSQMSKLLNLDQVEQEKNIVTFGKDLGIDILNEISIIHKTYEINKNKLTIGIIGHIRQDYEKIFSYLDAISDLSEYIINKDTIRKRIG